jgi:hypothetical protein
MADEPITDGAYREALKMLNFVRQAAMDSQVDLPTKQLVTAGSIVHDCEMVAVCMTAVTTGLPGSSVPGGTAIAQCPLPFQIILEIAVARCGPVMDDSGSKTAADLTSFASVRATDTFLLMQAADMRAAEQFGSVTFTLSYPPQQGEFISTVARMSMAMSS